MCNKNIGKIRKIKKVNSYYEYGIKKEEIIEEFEEEKELYVTFDQDSKNLSEELIPAEEENKNTKSIPNQIKELLKNEISWKIIPILFSIFYFLVDSMYKYQMGKKFYLPSKYFSLDLRNIGIYLILIVLSQVLYFWILKSNKNNNIKKITKIIFFISLLYITKKFLEVEIFVLYTSFYLLALFSIFYFFIIYLEKKCIKIIILFSLILFLIIKIQPTILQLIPMKYNINSYIEKIRNIPGEVFYGGIILIIIINCISLFFSNDTRKEENRENLIFLFFIYYYIAILIFSCYLIPKIISKKNDYEVFYEGDNVYKAIITTYEDKYLIMDCEYDKKENKIIKICTKNYEFININKVDSKKINYSNYKEEPEIKNESQEKIEK